MQRPMCYLELKKSIQEMLQNAKNALRLITIGSVLVVVYHLFIGFLMRVPGTETIKSILMQVFGILMPGLALYSLLYKRIQTLLGVLFISYLLGYASNIASYFLLVPFGLGEIIPYYVVLLTIVSIVVICRKNNRIELKFSKNDIAHWIFFLLFLVLSTIVYSGANPSPIATGSTWVPQDLLFWIENASALAGGFPTTNPRVFANETLYYHYFSSIQVAYLNLATGIDCFTLAVPLYALGKSLVFYGAFYVLFSEITKKKWVYLIGFIAVCCTCGIDGFTHVTTVSHIWTLPFGFDIGFAYGAFFLHCFYLQWDKKKLDARVLLLSVIAISVCSGAKMPVAIAVIAAAGIICIYWLFTRQFKLAFTYGACILATFAIIAVFCAGVGYGSAESRVGEFSLWVNIRGSSSLMWKIYELFPANFPTICKWLCIAFVYFLLAGPLVFGGFTVAWVMVLFNKKLRNAQTVGLIFGGMLCMLLGITNVQPGYSQMYFIMASIIPCALLSVIWLDKASDTWSSRKTGVAKTLIGAVVVGQLVCFMFVGYTYWGNGIVSAVKEGCINMFAQEKALQEFRVDGLQNEDVAALSWIRKNSSKDSVVLADRSIVGEMPKYMWYGAISERQMYLEGDVYSRESYVPERNRLREITQGVYQNSADCLQAAIDDGVDYIIQTIWLTPEFQADTEKLTLVFSSETINVYEVKK